MLELIDGFLCFIGNLLQTNPNQKSTGNVISNNSCLAALTTFQSSQLFGFSVKLLDLSTKATHFLYSLRVVLCHAVGHKTVRGLGRKNTLRDNLKYGMYNKTPADLASQAGVADYFSLITDNYFSPHNLRCTTLKCAWYDNLTNG